jgi:Sulfatase
MSFKRLAWICVLLFAFLTLGAPSFALQQKGKPNIVFIMGDDIGWFNVGAYHQGMMAGRTPNLDRLAAEGMRFTDYYAEASCTAGRANFITGELPIRTGLTTVGQAGSTVGIPDEAPTIAAALKSMAVREKPSRRSEQIPSDRSRIRRILRLPLSPRRDGRSLPSELPAFGISNGRPAQHGS